MSEKEDDEFIDQIAESVKKTNEAIYRATEPLRKQQELLNKLAEPIRIQNQLAQSIAPIVNQTTVAQNMANAMKANLPDFSKVYRSAAMDVIGSQTAQLVQSVAPIIKQQAITQNIANAMIFSLPDFSQAYRSAALDIISAQTAQFASLAASITTQYQSSAYKAMQEVIRLPVMDWLHSIDLSPIYGCLQQLGDFIPKNFDRRLFSDIYLTEMYDAKWFPYAGWDADIHLIKEVLNVLDSTRKSKNRVKQIDSLIFSYYDDKTVETMKKDWRKKEMPEHIMRMLHQSVQAYHRKEYALTIAVLATLWEGIIYEKVNLPHSTQKQTKESLDKLIEQNEFTEIFKSYYDEFIMYRCYKPEEVKEDVPGRNGVAHGWYTKYPSRKAALNAILFTDFLLALEPLQEEEING